MNRDNIAFIALAALLPASLLLAGCIAPLNSGNNPPVNTYGTAGKNSFGSWQEVSDFLRAANPNSGYAYGGMRGGMMLDTIATGAPAPQAPGAEGSKASDYSQTNVQVAGVDEADTVKNDGQYIYTIGNEYYNYGVGPFSYGGSRGKVTIVDAFPAAQMKIKSEVSFDGSADGIFIQGGKLVVFGSRYDQRVYPAYSMPVCDRCIMPPYYSQNFAFMKVYDISDKANPKLVKEIEVKGSYVTARMIDGEVYAVFSDYASYQDPVPLYAVDGVSKQIAPSEISYFDWPDDNYNYNIFVSLDLNDMSKEETRKVFLMGYAQTLFISKDNAYVTYTKYDRYYPEWQALSEVYGSYLPDEAKQRISAIDSSSASDWRKDRMKMAEIADYAQQISDKLSTSQRESLQETYYNKLTALQQSRAAQAEKTAINRVRLSDFSLEATGTVPGHVLNQFSMDESGEYFRIATTVSQVWGWNGQTVKPSSSSLHVLDMNLKTVGSVEGMAPGETIYSVRFMGDRAYMVTFKKTDPLFVIGLSNPSNPQILGKLKIPGYSDYLHPYDETHIIGLGKGAEEDKEGDFAWYQGVKLSLFDVSDLANPREVANFEIGDRGTESYALQDHKAFLFSKERNLLVIPVLEAKIDPSKYPAGSMPQWQYGDYVFQGAYVFSITPEDGFRLRGRVTHATEDEMMKSGSYYYSDSSVKRSLYMDSALYTISDRFVKANSLASLEPLSSVQVSHGSQQEYYYGGRSMPATAPGTPIDG